MVRYRRRLNYDRKLSRALMLADGRRLVTLRAAANVITDVLVSANSPSHTLEHAIALLLKAAKSGAAADVAEATDQVELVLRAWHILADVDRTRS
jgi:hypothetical protein